MRRFRVNVHLVKRTTAWQLVSSCYGLNSIKTITEDLILFVTTQSLQFNYNDLKELSPRNALIDFILVKDDLCYCYTYMPRYIWLLVGYRMIFEPKWR